MNFRAAIEAAEAKRRELIEQQQPEAKIIL
jgi:hypothetical protein